jgi:hypothetical protein
LDRLSAQLSDVPRQAWDQYLWEFCEELLTQAASGQCDGGERRDAERLGHGSYAGRRFSGE